MALKQKRNSRNSRLIECIASKKPTADKLILLRRCLEQGADVNTTDGEGKTSLHLTMSLRKPIIVKLLLKFGANVNAQDTCKSTPLHEAVVFKDTFIMELLLSKGADVNAQKIDGYTPLHIASSSKKPSLVELLLAAGAKVDAQAKNNDTPLHIAARFRNNTPIVELLLKNGADVNAKSCDGWTPLHAASLSGAASVVELLLNSGANANAQKLCGETPLHEAARSGAISVVELLLNKGADVNCFTDHGYTPMHDAAHFGFADVIQLLLNKGYKVNSQTLDKYTELHAAARSKNKFAVKLLLDNGSDVNAKTTRGYTPLHVASLSGVTEIVELLIYNGADIHAQLDSGDTALHEAVRSGVMSIVEMLLKRGADVNALTAKSYTPLHAAASHGETDIAMLLLKYGAHINALTVDGITPLHQAVVWEKAALVNLLLNEGAYVNTQTKYGYTPLHMAARCGFVSIMKLLLDKGADVNAQSLDDVTPLHESVRSEKTHITELLINNGADINSKVKDGYTPLHGAAKSGLTSMVELLLNKGADMNSLTKNNSTPLLEAARSGNTSVVKLFLKRRANINCRDRYGYTPLHGAVSYKQKPIAVYQRRTDGDRNRPQQEISNLINISVAELLLDNGAEVNAKLINGYTPLHEASLFENVCIIKLLLKRGANVDAVSKNKVTPLHQAVNSGDISKVELLLNEGADVNAQKTDGDTPLHLALRKEDAAIATLLVHRGANVLLRNKTKDTPLCYSSLFSFSDSTEIVSLLQNAENEANENGHSLSHYTQINNEDLILNSDINLNVPFKYSKNNNTSGVAGQLYETKIVSLIFLRLLNHEQIEHDIFFGVNIDGIGAMDDICLRYRVRGRCKEVVLFIQVKHRDDPNKGKLTDEALWRPEGDFSLRKYFKSYLMIKERFHVGNEDPMFEGKFDDVDCYFILYTSANEHLANKNTKNQIDYIVHDLLNTRKDTQNFQYSHDEVDTDHLTELAAGTTIESLEDVDDFFSKLWFYTGQAKQDEVENIIHKEISKHYNNEINKHFKFSNHANAIFLKAHHEIQKWCMKRDLVPYLCRADDFFSRAKIACLDEVFMTVHHAMNDLEISINLDFIKKFAENRSISKNENSVRTLNTVLSRMQEIFKSKNGSATLEYNFEKYIVNLLLTNGSENNLQREDQPKISTNIIKSKITDTVTNNSIHNNMYLKRSGTSGLGGALYRIKMLCLILLRMQEHDQIQTDFQLRSKISGISFFNDISLRYQTIGQQKPVVLFLQLVHREDSEKGQLTVEEVKNDSGNFSFRKYYKSYLEWKEQFHFANKDPMFEGKFKDIDSYFILSTSAKSNFAKKKTGSRMNEVLQDLIKTKQGTEPFQYEHDETDINCLTKMIIMEQIETLGSAFLNLMMSGKYKPDIMADKLIARYHVALRQEVLEPCDIQSSKEHRTWQFRSEFFNSNDEYLATLQRTFDKTLSLNHRDPNKSNKFEPNHKSNDYVKQLKSLKIELPLSFGNFDMTFRKNKDKVSKRVKMLADKVMHLMKQNTDTKIVEINDDDVGPGKIIEQGIIDINGGIGGAVGNLLVSDTSNMLKFDLENEELPHNAALFLKELKDDRHKPFNELISAYRFKINISDYSKTSFKEDEYDKKQARDFLSKFWFYPNQAKEEEVEQIFREEIVKKYSVSKIGYNHKSRNTSDLISLHSFDEIQKWWMQTNESPYLSRASELFERAELADIYNLLQTVINYMYISNINRLDIKVKRINEENRTEQMCQMFKKIFVQLFNMFDPQFKGSFDFKLQYSFFKITDTSELSLRIHPEVEWVSLILVAGYGHYRYRVVAKAGPSPSSGCYQAKDGFMIREQIFDQTFYTTRDCLENIFVHDHELYASSFTSMFLLRNKEE